MGLVSDYSDGTPVVAFQVARADGRVLASRQPDREFYAASTVKLAVLAAAARALQHGSATVDEPLVSRDTFDSQVAGEPPYRLVPDDVDAGMAPPGSTMPLWEVVERMIVVSSNEATNMVVERLGLASVARVLADAGADGVRMGRQLGDRAAARRDGPANLVTAAGLVRLMSAVVTGRLCDPRWTGWMTAVLSRQENRLLTADLPDGAVWGSKSGAVTAIRHDVAFVGEPGPEALVVAGCTSGIGHDEASEALRAVGSLAVGLTA